MSTSDKLKTKILVVDHVRHLAPDLEYRLGKLGCEACGRSADARTAVEMVEKHRPDLVIMDILFRDDTDGFEATEAIRGKWNIPLVFLVDNSDANLLESAKRISPFGCVPRPFQDESLRTAIETTMYINRLNAEREQVEFALRESEERYQKAQAIGRVGSWEYNIQTTRFWGSDEAKRIYGFDPNADDFSTDEIERCIPERKRVHQALVDLIEKDKEYNLEFDIITKDEKKRKTIISLADLERDEAGRPIKITGVIQDITDRKKAELELRESEERYRLIADKTTDSIWAMDSDLRFTYLSPSTERLFGYTVEEWETLEWEVFVHPDYLDDVIRIYDVFKSNPQEDNTTASAIVRRKDGREMWVEFSASAVRDPSGGFMGVVGVTRDITERKRAEEEKQNLLSQLQHAHKMEAIGNLAGGIAHDFNNLLQAINGYTQLLLMDKTEKDLEHQKLTAIQKAGNRASALISQLLLFSRKADLDRRPLALNLETENALKLLERTLPKMVSIEFRSEADLWTILADPVQVEQILLNLGNNASDAMPGGGRLIIETENVVLDQNFADRNLGAQPGQYVLLTISDTGHGMDQATQRQIFEPFFTTKESGKGTGLGLASVYGIVKSHGGYISCYSAVGRGTAFQIYFPAVEPSAVADSKEVEAGPLPGGIETILLVEDEEAVADVARQALEQFGYSVVTASTGEKALELFADKGADIDLIVLDLGMPGMGGHMCLKELLKLKPDQKVVIATGYSANEEVKNSMDAGAAGYIGKPYKLSDLLYTVRDVLDLERPRPSK